MKDVQSGPADVFIPIDRAGVKNLSLPLVVRDRASGKQHTVAQVDLSVDLPAEFKGTHMSRFVEALENWGEDLDYKSFKRLLENITGRLRASRAFARLRFPYFLQRVSPASGRGSRMGYVCTVEGEYEKNQLVFTLGVEVPVMTVCPCSLAISKIGAHSQRAEVRIRARVKGFVWLEDLIDIAEAAGSSPVYALLKREDEKAVTENAFANPTFVEDVVRNAALGLIQWNEEHKSQGQGQSQPNAITWFRVEVESFESIHAHSAHASLEKTLEKS